MTNATLADRRNDMTLRLILDAAVELLEQGGVRELTMRAVAKRANISERTVFRYYATREDFLDAVAEEARARMNLPAPPRSMSELYEAPRVLYAALEAAQKLVIAGLHSELHDRIREAAARTRWKAIRKLIDEYAPASDARERKIVAANVCFYLGATAWHYYRFYFRMSPDETVSAAESAIRLALASLHTRTSGVSRVPRTG
jgi:AcrR family transcriptional regulator